MNTYDHRSYVACQILPNPKPKRKIPQTSVFVLVEMKNAVNYESDRIGKLLSPPIPK